MVRRPDSHTVECNSLMRIVRAWTCNSKAIIGRTAEPSTPTVDSRQSSEDRGPHNRQTNVAMTPFQLFGDGPRRILVVPQPTSGENMPKWRGRRERKRGERRHIFKTNIATMSTVSCGDGEGQCRVQEAHARTNINKRDK